MGKMGNMEEGKMSSSRGGYAGYVADVRPRAVDIQVPNTEMPA